MKQSKVTIFLSMVFPALLAVLFVGFPPTQHFLFGWFDSIANFFGGLWSGLLSLFHIQSAPALGSQQQFASALGALENNTQNIASSAVSQAEQYGYGSSTGRTVAVEVTDVNSSANNTVIGQFTAIWNGTSQTLVIDPGIANTTITPLYSVVATHAAFMPVVQAIARADFISAYADYSGDASSGSITYTKLR